MDSGREEGGDGKRVPEAGRGGGSGERGSAWRTAAAAPGDAAPVPFFRPGLLPVQTLAHGLRARVRVPVSAAIGEH